jgi:hypothetical protein
MSDSPLVDLVHLSEQFIDDGAFLMHADARERYEKKLVFFARRVVAEADGMPPPVEDA